MKFTFTICFFFIFLGCKTDQYYTLTVIEKYDTYYAMHLTDEEGFEIEERFDGIIIEITLNGENVGRMVAYQRWFDPQRLEYPAIGSEITVPKFNFEQNSLGFTDDYTIEYHDLMDMNRN